MHNFISGLMGFFMGLSSFFHAGNALPPQTNQPQTMVSGTPASQSGIMRGQFGRGRGMQLPNGERPFFGTVTAINGSILTVQMQQVRGMRFMNPTISPTVTPPAPKTITITITSATTFLGGAQSDITVNTRIAGAGTITSDGNITAVQIRINPTMPRGFPQRLPMQPNNQ